MSLMSQKPIFAKIDVGEGHRSPEAEKSDCTVRALTIAAAISYENAWEMLYHHQGDRRANYFNLGALLDDRFIHLTLLRNAAAHSPLPSRWMVTRALSFPAIKGRPRMTPATFVKKFPQGRFVLSLAHHVVAVREGLIIDTWDCTKRCVYSAWEIELPQEKEIST